MRFSTTTKCFYPENANYTELPDDLIDVTRKEHEAALNRKKGEVLDVIDGRLVIVAAPGPSDADLYANAKAARAAAFTAEADPLFFKWQAGEGTEADWKAKREEIRNRFPYPAGYGEQ